MKAIYYETYGTAEVLQLKEVEKPAPKEDEVLIKVHASSINAMEWHLLSADIVLVRLMGMGLRKPKNPYLGTDVAGQVEAVGGNVRQFKPGDAVFGFGKNTYAEYACAKENLLLPKPEDLTFGQSAAIPIAAITAVQGLRNVGNLRAGQTVLIQGASGGVGTFAVQIAKALGAEVTAVCSTRNIDMVRGLGADHIIDYKKEDFTRIGQQYDLILGVNGYHSLWEYRRALKPNGTYVMAGGTFGQIIQAMTLGALVSTGDKKLRGVSAQSNQKDLIFVRDLVEDGKVKPVIDASYPLEKTVEAFRYYADVHPKGKVILNMV